MNTLRVQIIGRSAKQFIMQYGYSEGHIFKIARLCFENGKIKSFSIKIPKEITGYNSDTIADFNAKEGIVSGMIDFTI